ncbi:MAG: NUDIX domain-containing protein [Candidatus Thalassarchaeaceae archaeon]|jgi:8-oxo-dGTP pyrophosphatase MutT (NUDIX family)|nr:NUDIX domain-containing protein [Candidatus Thalassarchaeaceae archaeon]
METSCGVVLVNFGSVLLLQYPQGHWGFPKGHYEPTDEDFHHTALRELKEETGISSVELIEDWRMRTEYDFTRKGKVVVKQVYWYIGETDEYDISLSHEHRNYMWVDWDGAEAQLTFDQSKRVLKGARAQLQSLGRD